MNGQPIGSQRLPVAMETLDEPLYVNAKQYHRIIKRRQARAKLEAEGKIPKVRKVSSWYFLCVQSHTCSPVVPPAFLGNAVEPRLSGFVCSWRNSPG